MATKKQKRQQAIERREHFLAELNRTNAEVLAKVQEHRFEEACRAWQSNHDKNHGPRNRITECPICQIAVATKQDPGQPSQAAS